MRINLVAFDNGVGNSRDIVLMADALRSAGHRVTVTSVTRSTRRRRRSEIIRGIARLRRWFRKFHAGPGADAFDVNIMMEHIWPEALHLARSNVVVPNPEWFDRTDRQMLDCMDAVWTKTSYAQSIFANRHQQTLLIGFSSQDRLDAAVAREPTFLHLAGKSRMKGTGRLVRMWAQHPQWPLLTVIHSRQAAFDVVKAANIHYETRHLSDTELLQRQNRHRFHVCTSETEGWGHYIPEALSVGAIVLATDAPPMNELVTAERGLLLESETTGLQHLATRYSFKKSALEQAVAQALSMDAARQRRLTESARSWFVQNQIGFPARVRHALTELDLSRKSAV